MFSVSDAAAKVMMVILKRFIFRIGDLLNNSELKNAVDSVPKSYKGLLRFIGLGCKNAVLYVVCPSCGCVYNYEQCIETRAGHTIAHKCQFVAFPNHVRRDQREPCNSPLLKEVKTKNGNKIHFLPIKSYPYQSLKEGIGTLVSNPEFLTLCDHWRNGRDVLNGILADVYDGTVWQDFNSDKYNNYLKLPGNLLLSLNTDWFQPFERTKYSVGVLYLVILNLPRDQRYKMENIIIVGVIPGPKEPKLTMNSFIGPLVQELNSAYNGWKIPTNHPVLKHVTVRLCVGCVSSDIPATRKLCGFLGHAARLGCNKCLTSFPTARFGEKPDFSGFNRDEWDLRTKNGHISSCMEIQNATSKTSLESLEAQYGVRYSALIDLPMFDPIRFPVIDPMHNMLLGTSKHVVKLWIKREFLTPTNLETIEARSKLLSFPYDVGRIPCKIASSFSGFTADQWRVWTTIISPIVLKGILPNDDLNCWLLFVNACRLLMTRIISIDNVKQADKYLMLFCKKFQRLYGNNACTPNMHLHMHLQDCILDYGPVHGFWCFPFERYNGILGAYPTNNKNIEVQMMNRFIRHQAIKRMSVSNNIFLDVLKDELQVEMKGSLQETNHVEILSLIQLATVVNLNIMSFQLPSSSTYIKIISPIYEKVLSTVEANHLRSFYQQLHPTKSIEFFSLFYTYCKKVVFVNDVFESGSVIMAYWAGNGSYINNINYSTCRVGVIQHFLKHPIKFAGDSTCTFILCYIKWKQLHPCFDFYGKSTIVSSTLNEIPDLCCYMPLQRIAFRCASGEMYVDLGEICEIVFVASPIAMKFCI